MPPNARIELPEESSTTFRDDTKFPVTQWNVVAQAAANGCAEGEEALNRICQRYWLPLYVFARRSGRTPEDAEDLTQEFLISVARKNILQEATSTRGKLRTFLLSAFDKHMVSTYRKNTTIRRGGRRRGQYLTLDAAEQLLAEDALAFDDGFSKTPRDVYDRRWALALLDRVIVRLREKYKKRGGLEVFECLRPFLPGGEGPGHRSQVEIAEQLGLEPNIVTVRIHRLRKYYGQLLREEIAATVDPDDVEEEMQHLFSIFERR